MWLFCSVLTLVLKVLCQLSGSKLWQATLNKTREFIFFYFKIAVLMREPAKAALLMVSYRARYGTSNSSCSYLTHVGCQGLYTLIMIEDNIFYLFVIYLFIVTKYWEN